MCGKCENCGYIPSKKEEWNEFRIISDDPTILAGTLPPYNPVRLTLRGVVKNGVLVIRVPPNAERPEYDAFMTWCKQQNIVLSGFTGVVRETQAA
ncbi:MAG: hypothetical protein UV60_C0004G0052 [Parcubacteria group bacterium GW2011_GWA2_43_11]|nr:MAG: hypothetical protein UU89_C0017G0016 [Parcubacteria group bacterium GW2011_GWC2_42_11]KKS85975.1 MAG: hypothetical protein UV60_C0004G0052 [Parcubacteria group bacterium GW2011_GWA2_43_11]